MSQEIFVVAYEREGDSSSVLTYAAERARKDGATIHVVHVLEWSPYTFLTQEEVEERTTRRKEEMTRAKEAIIDPALDKLRAAGVEATGEIRFGQVVEIISESATRIGASMIFVGRAGSNSVAARVFGSVPIGLAQIATVPTVIVP